MKNSWLHEPANRIRPVNTHDPNAGRLSDSKLAPRPNVGPLLLNQVEYLAKAVERGARTSTCTCA